MKVVSNLIIALLIVTGVLAAVIFILPLNVEARQSEPYLGDVAVNSQSPPGGEVQLSSGTNSFVPEIAANDDFAAIVFMENNQVYLRVAQTNWGNRKLLDTTNNGNFPKLSISPNSTNTVHIVWTGEVAGTPKHAIRHIRCTLAEPAVTDCSSITTIASTAFSTTTLDSPDIVVDNDGDVHIVWVDRSNSAGVIDKIKSVRSGDNGATFGTIAQFNLTADDGGTALPALAASPTGNDFVHLAYVDRTSLVGGSWVVRYLRTGDDANPHSWGTPPNSTTPFGEVLSHDQIRNPTIAAGTDKVYLAWDTQNNTTFNLYGLVGIANSNDGGSASWEAKARDIPSTTQVDLVTVPDDKLSHDGAAPSIEDHLRPSVVLSGTNDFVIVWQQRPDDECPDVGGIVANSVGNGTSEIYRAESQGNGWALVDTVAAGTSEYKISPDVAVDSNGRMHIVYMKAPAPGGTSCDDGGSQEGYGIYYYGPIQGKWPENVITLNNLQKNVDGISSRYIVTNTGISTAQTAHQFFDNGGAMVTWESSTISPGASQTYDLASITGLPDGYMGYVEIVSDEPITSTVLGSQGPLIFIPGITGSYLVDQNDNNKVLWPGLLTSHGPLSLYLEDNPSSGIIATDAIRQVTAFKKIYGPLLETLVNEGGYREYQVDGNPERRTTLDCDYANQSSQNPNLFVFAYDWRKDNTINTIALKDYMGCIQQFHPNQPVTILTHSMGGLLARRYILKNPNDHNVNMLITIAAPWLGSPKMVHVLETGDFVPFVTDKTIKDIVGSFTAAHQLLPGHAYYDELGGGPIFGEDGWDVDSDGQTQELYTYNE